MAKLTGGRLAAALAFKAARGRKGISQTALARATGVQREVINRFETGKTWPDATTQAKLEPAVNLPTGELEDIAARFKPDSERFGSQEQAEAYLRLQMIEREAIRRRVVLLRAAAAERREDDVQRLTDEIDEILKGPESD